MTIGMQTEPAATPAQPTPEMLRAEAIADLRREGLSLGEAVLIVNRGERSEEQQRGIRSYLRACYEAEINVRPH